MVSDTTPRYRYREQAPEVISVPAAELLERLPAELRMEAGKGTASGRLIDLPCSEILRGNVPRITLGRLGELASGLVRVPEGRDLSERINLPPGWIALHFRMATRREELPPEPSGEETPAVSEHVASETSEVPDMVASKVEGPLGDSEHVSRMPVSSQESSGKRGAVAVIAEEAGVAEASHAKEQSSSLKKGFFASMPIFRRAEMAEKPPSPLCPSGSPDSSGPVEDPSETAPGNELVPVSPALERLWKLDPQDELADASALQALFMTDEKLTLEKVVSRAGELPGLDACVLAHGDRVICASKAPAGTDLQTLSGQAMTMLAQIRDSSEKMGLGAVPAVTLHADRGVVSFLHRGELCLLVLHADRGFVPGVRERLQEMLGHLSEARRSLPQPVS